MEITTFNNGENCSNFSNCNCDADRYNTERQAHVHELVGSTQTEDNSCSCGQHNHRFVTVTGEAEYREGVRGHVHKVEFTTDTFDGHYHEFCGYSEGAVDVGCGRHVHLVKDETTRNSQHDHDFIVATLIENPTGYEYNK